jgi:hypothetical protein
MKVAKLSKTMGSDVQYVGTALSIILGGRGKENREEFYRFPHPLLHPSWNYTTVYPNTSHLKTRKGEGVFSLCKLGIMAAEGHLAFFGLRYKKYLERRLLRLERLEKKK